LQKLKSEVDICIRIVLGVDRRSCVNDYKIISGHTIDR